MKFIDKPVGPLNSSGKIKIFSQAYPFIILFQLVEWFNINIVFRVGVYNIAPSVSNLGLVTITVKHFFSDIHPGGMDTDDNVLGGDIIESSQALRGFGDYNHPIFNGRIENPTMAIGVIDKIKAGRGGGKGNGRVKKKKQN